MTGNDRRTRQHPGDVRRGKGLPGVWSQPLQIVGEDPVGAELALDAHRRRDIGEPEQAVKVGEREHQLTEHSVGAVDLE